MSEAPQEVSPAPQTPANRQPHPRSPNHTDEGLGHVSQRPRFDNNASGETKEEEEEKVDEPSFVTPPPIQRQNRRQTTERTSQPSAQDNDREGYQEQDAHFIQENDLVVIFTSDIIDDVSGGRRTVFEVKQIEYNETGVVRSIVVEVDKHHGPISDSNRMHYNGGNRVLPCSQFSMESRYTMKLSSSTSLWSFEGMDNLKDGFKLYLSRSRIDLDYSSVFTTIEALAKFDQSDAAIRLITQLPKTLSKKAKLAKMTPLFYDTNASVMIDLSKARGGMRGFLDRIHSQG